MWTVRNFSVVYFHNVIVPFLFWTPPPPPPNHHLHPIRKAGFAPAVGSKYKTGAVENVIGTGGK